MRKQLVVVVCMLFCFTGVVAQNYQLAVLGVMQDGGYPQAGCMDLCCNEEAGSVKQKFVTSIALIDVKQQKWWLFEATPDLPNQLQYFQKLTAGKYSFLPTGIFLTHAHIGHYTGLMYLGKEVMNAHKVPIYVMPRMKGYLTKNGPWSQLVDFQNIQVLEMKDTVVLNANLSIHPFIVPHRDEYSETVGYTGLLDGNKQFAFIPDIDKWEKASFSLEQLVLQHSLLFLDATFYGDGELKNRSMKEVPHPLVQETQLLLKHLSKKEKSKVFFIHFNHTNPLIKTSSSAYDKISSEFNVACEGMIFNF